MFYNYDRSRFQNVFTKLQALSLYQEYDRVLMLDNDMLVLRNGLEEVFRCLNAFPHSFLVNSPNFHGIPCAAAVAPCAVSFLDSLSFEECHM